MKTLQEKLKELGIEVSELSNKVLNSAIAGMWQPLECEGKFMLLGVVLDNPTEIIKDETREKKQFLLVDLSKKSFLPTTQIEKAKEIALPLLHNKSKFGKNGQKHVDEFYQALVMGDFDKATDCATKACSGNEQYKNKINVINSMFDENKNTKSTALKQSALTK